MISIIFTMFKAQFSCNVITGLWDSTIKIVLYTNSY